MKTADTHPAWWLEYRWSVALLALVFLWLATIAVTPRLGDRLGLMLRQGWFTDLHAVLAAGEAHAQGIPVHESNPLDNFHRPHSYPACWLVVGAWGLVREDTFWVGALWVAAFLLVAIFTYRPRTPREFAWGAVLLLSPAFLLGVVRANNDLVIFLVLAALPRCLASSQRWVRFAAVGIVAAAAGLKYYPAVAAILLLGETNRRLFAWRAVVAVLLFAFVGWTVYEDTRHFATSLPSPNGVFSFGATRGLEQLGLSTACAGWILAALVLATIGFERRRPAEGDSAPDRAELGFVLGAVLLAGCFWAGMNWAYRWIFALWMLPVLLGVHRPGGVLRRWEQRTLLALLPLCLWADGLSCLGWNLAGSAQIGIPAARNIHFGWLAMQPLHWLAFSLLTVASVRFAWRGARRSFGKSGARSVATA